MSSLNYYVHKYIVLPIQVKLYLENDTITYVYNGYNVTLKHSKLISKEENNLSTNFIIEFF